MRQLAIECASEACSIALFEDGNLMANHHLELGRGHAERLVPLIAKLPDKGKAERILVSLGPGSFTGVRVGLATARALGFAWDAQVMGYPTLALAAQHASQSGPSPATVCMNGGHGEWFIQNFEANGIHDEVRSLTPEAAKAACRHEVIVGNRAVELASLFPEDRQVFNCLPNANMILGVNDSALTDDLTPIYGRVPDAKPASLPT